MLVVKLINNRLIYLCKKVLRLGMKKKYIYLFLVLIIAVSCSNYSDVILGEPEEVTVIGFEENFLKIHIAIPIENPTPYKIQILDIDTKVFLNDRYIGKLVVDENITIHRKESHIYKLPVKIRLANLFGTAFIMMTLKKGQEVDVRFEGTVTGKSMLIKKTYEINESRKIKI